MPKLTKQDLERTLELKLKLWSEVAQKLLAGDKAPYETNRDNIEKHKGRVNRAIYLLGDLVEYTRDDINHPSQRNNYHSDKAQKIYTVKRFDESKDLVAAPTFNVCVPYLHDEIFGITNDLSDSGKMNNIGFRSLSSLSNREVLYIYWNQKDYILIHTNYGVEALPRDLEEIRTKNMLRAIIDQYLHSNFHSRIESCIGISDGAIKTEDHFDLSIRNFAAHGYRFSVEAYYGDGGFMKEYQHYHDYFEALLKNLSKFKEVIDAAGGQAAIIKTFRMDIISLLLRKATLFAFQPLKKESYDEEHSIEKTFKNPHFCGFLLANANFFDYDTIFKDDTSILVIDSTDSSYSLNGTDKTDTPFTPNRSELNMIESSK